MKLQVAFMTGCNRLQPNFISMCLLHIGISFCSSRTVCLTGESSITINDLWLLIAAATKTVIKIKEIVISIKIGIRTVVEIWEETEEAKYVTHDDEIAVH